MVFHSRPLLVAAYTDEQDTIALLRFPNELANEYQLKRGSRLLTVNTYAWGINGSPDFIEGPRSTRRYQNFFPIIAEFVSDDDELIQQRKTSILPGEWQRPRSSP